MSLLKVAAYIEHLHLKWEAEEGFACITLFNLHNNFCVICITLSPILQKKGFFYRKKRTLKRLRTRSNHMKLPSNNLPV